MDSAITSSQIIENLGSNPINTAKILDWLSLDISEISIPARFAKLQYVMGFLAKFPEDTQRFLVNKATRGKLVDKLDHLFEYSHLIEEKTENQNNLNDLDKELELVMNVGDLQRVEELQSLKGSVTNKLVELEKEITLYE